ncbi:unnamed protein product [marine sediment metagenome]|uniref:Uncharacterized protein n=1 Tax=marine sediment metagenome TaxID=412755 RepID=X1ALZ2_9ZZZZ
MSKKQSISYEELTPNDVRIIVNSGGESTEVMARVLERGSYTICDTPSEERGRKSNSKVVKHSES